MGRGIFNGYTGIIVIINVVAFLVYLILQAIFGPVYIDHLLAIQPFLILQGRYLWTFVTSMFLHVNLGHLFANMVSLIFVGGFIEKLIGKKRFLYVYFIGGFVASLFFVFLASFFGTSALGERFFGNTMLLAMGASGAIFALMGLLAVLIPKMKVLVFFVIPMPMWAAMIGLTFVLWIFSATLSLPIGNTAHLGGLLVGVVYGIYLKIKYPKKTKMISQYFGG
ncbi:MAG: rhomboid family intramembrane serine protease [archaeon]